MNLRELSAVLFIVCIGILSGQVEAQENLSCNGRRVLRNEREYLEHKICCRDKLKLVIGDKVNQNNQEQGCCDNARTPIYVKDYYLCNDTTLINRSNNPALKQCCENKVYNPQDEDCIYTRERCEVVDLTPKNNRPRSDADSKDCDKNNPLCCGNELLNERTQLCGLTGMIVMKRQSSDNDVCDLRIPYNTETHCCNAGFQLFPIQSDECREWRKPSNDTAHNKRKHKSKSKNSKEPPSYYLFKPEQKMGKCTYTGSLSITITRPKIIHDFEVTIHSHGNRCRKLRMNRWHIILTTDIVNLDFTSNIRISSRKNVIILSKSKSHLLDKKWITIE